MLMKNWKDYLLISIGCIIAAFAISIFLVPYKIAPGGVTGLATVAYHLTNGKMPVGITMLIINIPLLLVSYKTIGGSFFLRTIVGTVLLSLLIDFLEPYADVFSKLLIEDISISYSHDILLYAIFGGVIMGTGLGIVLRAGATTGGTDLAAKIVNKYIPTLTIGQMLIIVDLSVVIIVAIVFNSLLLSMYATVALAMASSVIDLVIKGFNYAKALYIISERQDEIAKRIMKEMDRGVTAFKAQGMYTGVDRQVLFCIILRSQIPIIKKIVKNIDDKAFVIMTDAREVLGEGFKQHE